MLQPEEAIDLGVVRQEFCISAQLLIKGSFLTYFAL